MFDEVTIPLPGGAALDAQFDAYLNAADEPTVELHLTFQSYDREVYQSAVIALPGEAFHLLAARLENFSTLVHNTYEGGSSD